MVNYRVLIATRTFGSTSQKPWEILTEAGCKLIRADMTQDINEEWLIKHLKGVDGAIIGNVPMSAYVLENASSLKVVSMHGVGVDHVDLEAASRLGVVIANCPGTNDQAVADLALGLMIAVARNIPNVVHELRDGVWGRHTGSELWNKTLGLIGFGRIGRGVANRGLGFEMKVLVFDPFIKVEQVDLPGSTLTSFEEVLKEADFLSLHAPLNGTTRNMIGEEQLATMKPSAYLINTARGGLVDEQALAKALSKGQIAGAALDVFVQEPPTNNKLLQLDNVVVTPHTGAHTKEAIERMGIMAAQNVVQTLLGKQPIHRVQ